MLRRPFKLTAYSPGWYVGDLRPEKFPPDRIAEIKHLWIEPYSDSGIALSISDSTYPSSAEDKKWVVNYEQLMDILQLVKLVDKYHRHY